MYEKKKSVWDVIIGNPVYVLSAMVMMYAITELLSGSPTAGDLRHILLTYGSLQLYELAIIALAAWITVRLVVPDDAATLLIVECLLIGSAFITLDELLAANTGRGIALCAAGLVLAAAKLALTRRPLDLAIGKTLRVLVWLGFALPVLWVPQMKSVASVPPAADWTAYLAWWSLGGLILLGTLAVWLSTEHHTAERSILPSAMLAAASVLSVGGHLFALHHSFLVSSRLSYVAPAFVAAAFSIVLAVHVVDRPVTKWTFVLSWLPCLGLVLLLFDPPSVRSSQGVMLVGAEILAVYGWLIVMTRKKWFALHLFALPALMFADQRRMITEHLTAHRGCWLAGLAFGLLAVGAVLTRYKHRRRLVSGPRDSA